MRSSSRIDFKKQRIYSRKWWIQCGIRPDVVTYCTLISGLCEAGRIDEALHVLAVEMKKLNCEPNLFCYGTVFKALVSARRCGEAEDLFWEAMSSGVDPDVKFCTELVKMYSFDLEKFESAREVVRWMVKSGCKPDVVMYSTLINGLCRAGRVEEAREVVDEMVKEKCEPNCLTFTPLLQAYCSNGRIEEAKRLLDSMESGNCSPDTVCYNVLIQGLCDKGDFDEVENVLRESSSKGWNPDAVSYNIYINGLCKVSRIEEAFRQLEVMLDKGLCPTVVTLNILLHRLCCESRVWDVKRLLERSSELDLDFNVVSYNTVMSRLCEVEEWFTVLKIFTDMVKKGIGPDTQSFNIVIYSLCRARKFRMAWCIFESKGFVPNVVSCNILMHQYLLAGKTNEFSSLVSFMQLNSIAPDKVTCNIRVDSLCREGKFSEAIHFCKSLKYVYSQELIAHLSHGLVKGGRLGDLLRLFEELLDKGLVLDCQVYDFLIAAFCEKGSCNSKEIFKICLILDKMLGV
ncbi:uncharacterized protein A4U43_C07F20380 [Asparagus officinalis]|uniref:Pentacotripeptide-repeat region of PRORP domain-containing protein n=1 Tax=Asparagus officinalis TaxID=4686 RepID=A0A5P1EIM5_ASPOF|nr:pentatricopeptide repeat-containing protein At5g64320, mitochondrial-like [Asparagus officinalis]ONK63930.1 uncharacterized protein A4U43_C07F20380 [Asparagus officinalis]